jgi:hypothetical protein
MTLEKALLKPDDGSEDIVFMFNPTELTFSRSLQLNTDSGARTDSGIPKVSFGYPQPYSLRISNILFDTRESQASVLPYVNQFKRTVQFTDFQLAPPGGRQQRSRGSGNQGPKKRPPTYMFTWSDNKYLRCFVKSLTYKLTLFTPEGVPVRAVIDLELEETDEATQRPPLRASRQADDNRRSRQS